MTTSSPRSVESPLDSGEVFDRVVCGLDGSDQALDAAWQAIRIAPLRPVLLVSAVNPADEVVERRALPAAAHAARETASLILDRAASTLADLGVASIEVAVEEGDVVDVLRYVTDGREDDLLAVGISDEPEPAIGPLLSPAGGERMVIRTIRAVGCSVLVARPAPDPHHFPRAITVGVDGSPAAARAYRRALAAAGVTGAEVEVLVALGGRGADLEALRSGEPPIPLDALQWDDPVGMLVAATDHADLLVVGHRGHHGLRGLGGVGARLVARSPRSVLVVRGR